MITSPRLLMRSMTDARIHAQVLEFLNDHSRNRWWTLAEIVPHVPLTLEQLARLFEAWHGLDWLENRQDSGRRLWRPTSGMPIVVKGEHGERIAWSKLYSALLELPVR